MRPRGVTGLGVKDGIVRVESYTEQKRSEVGRRGCCRYSLFSETILRCAWSVPCVGDDGMGIVLSGGVVAKRRALPEDTST